MEAEATRGTNYFTTNSTSKRSLSEETAQACLRAICQQCKDRVPRAQTERSNGFSNAHLLTDGARIFAMEISVPFPEAEAGAFAHSLGETRRSLFFSPNPPLLPRLERPLFFPAATSKSG